MDVIEFLKHTDHRNLKYNIDYLVKQKLRERDLELHERRQRLKDLLETESQQYETELSLLLKSRLEEKEAQRHDWIGLMRLERERAEEELLELKKKQLQLENAEEVRHIFSREMLMDSKQAQLYQIEEKKALRERQALMERYWLEVMQKYNQENEKQEIVEQKLRKVIANVEQQRNLEQNAETKAKARQEAIALREELNQDNIRAWNMDREYKKDEDFYEWRKKVHHRDVLERQMQQNAICADIQRQAEKIEANIESQLIQRDILTELDNEGAKTVRSRAEQKDYLIYTQKEKKLLREQQKDFDDKLIGTGCVLEQKNKRPYGKNTR